MKWVCFVFVCFGFIVPLENFSLTWRSHHYWWSTANVLPMLGTHGQWAVRVLYRVTPTGASVENGHLWGPVTLTLMPSFWQWNCQYLFLRLRSVAAGLEHPTFRLRDQHYYPLRHCPGEIKWDRSLWLLYIYTWRM